MIRRRRDRQAVPGYRLAVAVLTLVVAGALLDAGRAAALGDAGPAYVGASVFAFIWAGLQAVAGWLAAGATVTVSYLATAVSWLAGRVATFLLSTGAVFARVWEGIRIVWSDVLKPAILWIDDHLKRLHGWLQRTFRPVLDFLANLRERLFDLYRKFVRPVVDTIDFIRQVNRVLNAFGIHVLDALDRVLGRIESAIVDNFYFLLRVINRVQDAIDRIVDLNGFFQRYMLIASLRKYSPEWMAHFWRDQISPGAGSVRDRGGATDVEPRAVGKDAGELGQYFESQSGPRAAVIDELSANVFIAADAARHTP